MRNPANIPDFKQNEYFLDTQEKLLGPYGESASQQSHQRKRAKPNKKEFSIISSASSSTKYVLCSSVQPSASHHPLGTTSSGDSNCDGDRASETSSANSNYFSSTSSSSGSGNGDPHEHARGSHFTSPNPSTSSLMSAIVLPTLRNPSTTTAVRHNSASSRNSSPCDDGQQASNQSPSPAAPPALPDRDASGAISPLKIEPTNQSQSAPTSSRRTPGYRPRAGNLREFFSLAIPPKFFFEFCC
eukprot:c17401_g1_i1.p1 GENE.c17401_g1_i1~~c17401_g1_i1.p1  ORF type:complete len:271 (-),score=28.44 c17401_g1_i1:343-1071(-)